MNKGISEETKEKWIKKLKVCVATMHEGEITFSEWESDFLKNLKTQLIVHKQDLSMKQSSCLQNIYEKVQRRRK